ncbi:MAG: DNA translocase FtsK [Lachnospiraceae bacterium]|nr:DNA translocase FtsK [Lachnospiraceae bacterium]
MATTRKPQRKSTSKRSSSSAKRTTKSSVKDVKIKFEILFLLSFTFCVLLFLCNFGLIGVAGNFISKLDFGLFGVLAYIFPIYLFVMIFVGMRNLGAYNLRRKEIALFILFLSVCNITELIGGIAKTLETLSVKEIFEYSYSTHKGGGVIAATFVFLMLKLIGTWGTVILSIIAAIICIVIVSENSLVGKLKDSKDALSQHISENKTVKEEFYRQQNELREVKRKEREEERLKKIELNKAKALEKQTKTEEKSDEKILRMNKKVSGVTTDTLIVPKTDDKSENNDIHEIVLNNFDPESQSFDGFIDDIDEIVIEKEDNYYDEPIPVTNKEPLNVISEKPVKETLKAEKSSSAVKVENKSINHKYEFPSINLLTKNTSKNGSDSEESIKSTARKLISTLELFGVKASVDTISQGPTVTRFELIPEPGTKVSRIKGLSDDIKLNLATSDIRIEAPIPGKAAVGIEIPNKEAQSVLLRDLIDTQEFKQSGSDLTFAVGKDISGKVIVYDIDQFPHLLIAGATGSGKSVCINTLIVSLIYKAHPNDVKMIMIDPKVVELSVYNGIPHLMIPVVTDPKKAAAALNWAVTEMMERYKKFADLNVRDLKGYNKAVEQREKEEGPSDIHKKLPQIIVIVDELADLIMVAKNDVEDAICRLAQLARACGIHLIIATQRPSVDVITGLIKANMPSRLAFAVSSNIDSRTILDMGGAEELLGKGDMLFYPKGLKKPVRLQGAFVSDSDVNKIVDFLKPQAGAFSSDSDEITQKIEASSNASSSGLGQSSSDSDYDDLFIEAGKYVISNNKASIGNLQRVYRIGFNRAARIMDKLAEVGVVSADDGTKARTVLMSMEQFENFIENEL